MPLPDTEDDLQAFEAGMRYHLKRAGFTGLKLETMLEVATEVGMGKVKTAEEAMVVIAPFYQMEKQALPKAVPIALDDALKTLRIRKYDIKDLRAMLFKTMNIADSKTPTRRLSIPKGLYSSEKTAGKLLKGVFGRLISRVPSSTATLPEAALGRNLNSIRSAIGSSMYPSTGFKPISEEFWKSYTPNRTRSLLPQFIGKWQDRVGEGLRDTKAGIGEMFGRNGDPINGIQTAGRGLYNAAMGAGRGVGKGMRAAIDPNTKLPGARPALLAGVGAGAAYAVPRLFKSQPTAATPATTIAGSGAKFPGGDMMPKVKGVN
jgi:hypothetical protein